MHEELSAEQVTWLAENREDCWEVPIPLRGLDKEEGEEAEEAVMAPMSLLTSGDETWRGASDGVGGGCGLLCFCLSFSRLARVKVTPSKYKQVIFLISNLVY